MSPSKKSGNKRYVKWLWIIALSPLSFILLLFLAALLSGLPNIEALANPKINLATQILTTDNQILGTYYRENRSDVKFQDLPPHVVQALIATEDVRYREHSGVDFKSLFRAVASLGSQGGGSTITQQLAKMQFTERYENVSKVRRAWQKLKEIIIAVRLERHYTKDEIIALYLNQYDFLNQAVGIKSAAHIYFNTKPDSLNIEQSAMLVGMLQNSSLFNPLKRKEKVMQRREVVLKQMQVAGFLSEQQYDSLRVIPIALDFQRVSHDEGPAPYFREVLRSRIDDILTEKDKNGNLIRMKGDGTAYDLYRDGLKVYTTIDSKLQAHAEWAVNEHMTKELQAAFAKDTKRRKPEKYPFYNGISEGDQDRIMTDAVKSSERHHFYAGTLCPECKRPKAYIDEEKNEDGKDIFHCNEEHGGCGHKWAHSTKEEIEKIFNTPVKTRVYWPSGYRDTLISPLDSIKYHKAILHAGLMSVEPSTGQIKAWVGGIDFKYFKYDNVYQSRRQVGSTFKPFVYATALRNGDKPCSRYANLRTCIDLPSGGKWCPDNSDSNYGGEYPLSYALANSINTITAALIKKYGAESVVALAKNMGIKSKLPAVPSIALGVAELSLYEMVGANAVFANQGVYIEPTFILRIEDKNGNTIYEAAPEIKQSLSPDVAYQTVMMMKGVVQGGTGSRLMGGRPYGGISYPTAGKTGTTQNNTDGWFMGLTPDLVTGVWVGAQDPTVRFSRTSLGQGANTGLPIYGYYMNKVYKDPSIKISKSDFEAPTGYDAEKFRCINSDDPFLEEDGLGEEELFLPIDGEGEFEGDEKEQ